jgi:hypothetical protein
MPREFAMLDRSYRRIPSALLLSMIAPALAFAQAGAGPTSTPTPSGAGSTTTATTKPQTIDLRPKFERGQVLKYAITIDGATEAATPGSTTSPGTKPSTKPGSTAPQQPARTPAPTKPTSTRPDDLDAAGALPSATSHWELTLDLAVKNRAAETGATTIEATLKVVRARIAAGDDVTEFDASKPAKPSATPGPMDSILADLGKPQSMTLTVDADGNITSAAGAAPSPAPAAPGLPDANSLFRSIFTTARAPANASVGQSWTVQDTIDSGVLGHFKIMSSNRLVSHASNRAKITTEGKITPVSETGAQSPIEIQNSSYAGTTMWNTGSGSLESLDQTMTIAARLGSDANAPAMSYRAKTLVTRR